MVEEYTHLAIIYHSSNEYGIATSFCIDAAKYGDPRAQRLLGEMYYFGEGVEQDNAKAYEYLKKAVDQGDDRAKISLVAMFDEDIELSETERSLLYHERIRLQEKKKGLEVPKM